MIKKHISIFLVLLSVSFFSCSKSGVVSVPKYGDNDYTPDKKPRKKGSYSLQDEYEQRVIDVAKAKAKKNKEMKKPQYSDKTYFGHKKPPVKNPPGEKKYCKECGMWH